MDKNINAETVEATVNAEVTTDAVAEAFDAGWEGDGFTGVAYYAGDVTEDADSANDDEADQPDDETAVEETEADDDSAAVDAAGEEPMQENTGADQRFTLKHLDETREVSREEVIILAQKGLDYDRKTIKQANKIAEYEAFLDKLAAGSNLSREQVMDSILAGLFREQEKAEGREVSETEALFKIQKEREEKAQQEQANAEQAEQQRNEEAARKNDEMLARFMSAYPDVKATDIPQSVWDESRKTGDLLSAYVNHENARLRRQLETLEQNQRNKQRSTGSMQSAGATPQKDAFDEGWDSI